jgi:iron(III) transport system ATP-binding protein
MSLQETSSTFDHRSASHDWGKRNTAGVSIATRLELQNICHSYGDVAVLDNVSLVVEPGDVMCLLGPSGSGKTTLLRIVAGIEQQSSGRVLFDEREIAGPNEFLPPEKRGIGLVFQDYALFPHLTILGNVKFGLDKLSAKEAEHQARQVLARVGLEPLAKEYPHALSGGEQQRVALARALAPRPGILLMDEPFSGLDSRLRESVRDETLAILRESRATAIMVTHDPEEALRMGDRIALLRDGKVVQEGDGETLFQRPNSLFSASFFTELNVFEGRVRSGKLATPVGEADASGFAEGENICASIRLADIVLSANEGEGCRARVTAHRYLGIVDQVELQLEGHDQRIRARFRFGELSRQVIAGHGDVFVSAKTGCIRLYSL